MSDQPRFSVGIDLGTTNCVLSFVELAACDGEKAPLELFPIAQLTRPGTVDTSAQLPSFMYQAHEAELTASDVALPWNTQPDSISGLLARELGSKTPTRLVASAKSWLCHSGVDCRAPILPIHAPEEVPKVSPLQATMNYLKHLRDAWDHEHPEDILSEQDLVITVPASFDPAARELTVEAAHAVGLRQATLLEEPQSAVYSWIQASEGNWREQVRPGEIVLVVDVGGGTTDLSLIAVTEEDGSLILNRIAIGDHILLGGDNMDLALAYVVKMKLEKEGRRLEPWQLQAITHGCRDAKETLLSGDGMSEFPIVVPSRGSSLIGGTLRSSLTQEEVMTALVDGFFPRVGIEDKPLGQGRTALTTLGLPYARDARTTSHLASFLTRQSNAAQELGVTLPPGANFIHPNAVLLNGGVFKSEALVARLMEVVNGWLQSDGGQALRLLSGVDLDLAVAKGAAYYGYVRKGKGVRIRGGTAAAYYVGVESAMPAVPGLPTPIEAVCIAPFGMEEGTDAQLEQDEFGLVVGEPVKFRFFGSTVRRDDVVGTRLDWWTEDEIEELSPLEVNLTAEKRQQGEVVPVRLAARVNEVGTLQLEAKATNSSERWQVEFDVRGSSIVDEQRETISES
jgi:molecular chaperone DnaK (HSP70)